MPIRQAAPIVDLSKKTILLWGSPKVGKTTLASDFPDSVILATEAGLGDLPSNRWEYEDGRYVITSWGDLLTATAEVISSNVQTIVLDTCDNAYSLCERHICDKYGVEYKNDDKLAYGKGTTLINNEFKRYLLKLSSLGLGIVLTSHATQEERDGRTGKISVTVPTIPDKIRPIITGMVDMILFYTTRVVSSEEGRVIERVIFTKPDPSYEAGDRSGRLPDVIKIPKSEPYMVLANAYYGSAIAQKEKK